MKALLNTLLIVLLGLTACTKVMDGSSTSTNTGTTTGKANIRFYNVMDYGNVNVALNGADQGDVAIYYSTAYKQVAAGSRSIKVTFSGNTIVDANADLLSDKYYSCFIYRVGFNWRISIVTDDLTTPATGKAGVRVLDFRTQAYFNYVNVRVISVGLDQLDYTNRNFLDHLSYDTYTTFKQVAAGTYNINVFNDATNLSKKTGVTLGSGKIYSVLLVTPADLTAADALYNISLDFSTLK
ncbi:MAG: DUF4397 domain-containing protein [Flavobacterium sp.]|nr:DUF4397 domain-containing protein [Flavobacterium sp.]